ncbi:hypothetical protein LA304_17630 [Celeribacter sp. ASW11-22]|nr:hypothetical protein [Celeribacter litoreus]
MDIVGLEDAAEIGFVRRTRSQALERGFLIPEGEKEVIGKLIRIEGLLCKGGNCLFDFNSVHARLKLLFSFQSYGTSARSKERGAKSPPTQKPRSPDPILSSEKPDLRGRNVFRFILVAGGAET